MEENVGKSFKAPQTRIVPMNLGGEKKRNVNAGKTRLKSTAVYGRTIFWKETKKKINNEILCYIDTFCDFNSK